MNKTILKIPNNKKELNKFKKDLREIFKTSTKVLVFAENEEIKLIKLDNA